jgi:recombination protein RecT
MSKTALKAAVSNTAQTKPANFPAMLEQFKGEIARALPKHLNPDRMVRIALTAFRLNPKLAECDPKSVFAAVIQASQLGLEPDTLGRSYLIPYGRECQFVPGWKGLVDLVNRSGNATVWTGAVFKGDEFDFALGDRPFITHKPCGEDDENLITHVYAVGRIKGAEWPVIEVWPMSRVKRHRDRYNKVGKRHYSFENMEMYARKVVLLQVIKYMPASPELAAAISLNDAAEIGSQGLTVKDAIEGTWVPVTNNESVDHETGEIASGENGKSVEKWQPTPEEAEAIKQRELQEARADFE